MNPLRAHVDVLFQAASSPPLAAWLVLQTGILNWISLAEKLASDLPMGKHHTACMVSEKGGLGMW